MILACSFGTYTTTGTGGQLQRIASRLADSLQIERTQRGAVLLGSLDVERRGIGGDGDGVWPVGVHLTIVLVEALQLQLQIGAEDGKREEIFKSILDWELGAASLTGT